MAADVVTIALADVDRQIEAAEAKQAEIAEAHAVAEREPGGVGEGDLLVEPIAVIGERCADRRLFNKHRPGTAADEPHFGLEIDGVAEVVSAGKDRDGAAADARDAVHRRLDGFFVRAPDVAVRRADGDIEAVFPCGFDDGIAQSRAWGGLG